MDPTVEAHIHESFATQTMMQTLGATLTKIAPGEVEISAPVQDNSRQQHGVAHAALTFAIGDTAAGYAALSLMSAEAEVMTVEMKINLMAPGSGDLVATGRVLRPGRRLMVVAAEVWGDSAKGRVQVAALQGTMIPL